MRIEARQDVDAGNSDRLEKSWAALLKVVPIWVIVGTVNAADHAPEVRTTADRVYSEQQAERGAKVYAAECALCHGSEMRGGPGVPGIVGPVFKFNWSGRSAKELLEYLETSMPPGKTGTLSDQAYVDLIAAIFEGNGYPAGRTDLPAERDALATLWIERMPSK